MTTVNQKNLIDNVIDCVTFMSYFMSQARRKIRKQGRDSEAYRARCIKFAKRLQHDDVTDTEILRALINEMDLTYNLAMEVIGELYK